MKTSTISILLLLSLCTIPLHAQDSLLVVFWNLENHFDYRSEGKPQYLTKKRFYAKSGAFSKIILSIAQDHGRLPDAIGLCEIENRFAVRSLVTSTLLAKLDYRILHFESPDHRGIDCALLYRGSRMKLQNAFPRHIIDSTGSIVETRDILVAQFEGIDILVNHHPSQIGGKVDRRALAQQTLKTLFDSLRTEGSERVLAIGDFNEQLWPQSSQGTLKYNGRWEKIDGYFAAGKLEVGESVYNHPSLLTEDSKFGGHKPLRTFVGPRYQGGVSDHLPLVLEVVFR